MGREAITPRKALRFQPIRRTPHVERIHEPREAFAQLREPSILQHVPSVLAHSVVTHAHLVPTVAPASNSRCFRGRLSALLEQISTRRGPTVCQNARVPKREAARRSGNPKRIAALSWSGRQDSNLRPPGPERQSGAFDQLALPGTSSHPIDIIEDVRPGHPLNGTRAKPGEGGFVPVVSPGIRRKLMLPEQLLTVRQAAARLNISTASLYKLCSQNQVAHVRVGNTIRFNPAGLAADFRNKR
jgi:excisionase family DNA binding protein